LFGAVFSQDSIRRVPMHSNANSFWHRMIVGGYLSLQFGSITAVTVSPEVSIRIVNQLYGGLGFTYQYVSFKDYFWDNKNNNYLDFRSNVYGGRIFFRYYLRSLFDNFLGNFFAHAEYEYLYYTQPYTPVVPGDPAGTISDPNGVQYKPGRQSIDVNSLFVGGGYSQPIAGRAYLDLLLLFNLNESYNSPYSNPIFRIGFGIGL
jgi:hypothetical protein